MTSEACLGHFREHVAPLDLTGPQKKGVETKQGQNRFMRQVDDLGVADGVVHCGVFLP